MSLPSFATVIGLNAPAILQVPTPVVPTADDGAHDSVSLAEGAKFFGAKLDAWKQPHGARSVTMISKNDSFLSDIVNYEDLLYTIAPERAILNAVHCAGRVVTEAGIDIPNCKISKETEHKSGNSCMHK